MKLNRTQLKLFWFIAQRMRASPGEIRVALGISPSLTSKYLGELVKAGLLAKEGKKVFVSANDFARMLANLLAEDSTLIEVLSDQGIPLIFGLLAKGGNVKSMADELGLRSPSLYPYVRRFLQRQIVYKKDGLLFLNTKLWGGLCEFVRKYADYNALSCFKDLPNNAKIYFKSREVVFSLPSEYGLASRTAFSEFSRFGIRLMEKEFFYRLDSRRPRKLDIQTVFLDSLRVAAAENSARQRLYCYLLYRKHFQKLRAVKHPDLAILERIAAGEKINKDELPGFPSRDEIISKGEDYDIKI